jgi:hypothetical protein
MTPFIATRTLLLIEGRKQGAVSSIKPLWYAIISCYVLNMTLDELLRFTPVPVRAQHNGWCPARQQRFILSLARGLDVSEAARALGMTRQSAYRLREKAGAESFAAAWDRVQAFAREAASVRRSPMAGLGGIETVLVPRHYRGRLVGFVQREDTAGAMRALGQLDRLAEKLGDVNSDYATDEFLEGYLHGLSRSDRSDTMRPANPSTSSIPGKPRSGP